jgi:hypothetical protein
MSLLPSSALETSKRQCDRECRSYAAAGVCSTVVSRHICQCQSMQLRLQELTPTYGCTVHDLKAHILLLLIHLAVLQTYMQAPQSH